MKLSIIVPVYNVERYLPKCLDSLICPEIGGYEIIVVDDGSTDSSAQVAAGYARRFPELIRLISKTNGGLGSARNAGLEAARGEYLLFVDSDDWLCGGALPEIMEKLREDFDICIFGILSVSESGSVLDDVRSCSREGALSLAAFPQLLLAPPSACNKLCRRSLFMDSGIRFPGKVWYEDLRTMPKLYLLTDKITATDRQWYVYLQRPGSIINASGVRRNLEIIDAVDDLTAYYKAAGKLEQYKNELCYVAFYNQLLTASVRVCVADADSPVLSALRDDFLEKYPDYRENPYIREMPLKYKLLTFLFVHGRGRAAGLIMRLYGRARHKTI